MSKRGRRSPAPSATADREIVISRVISAPRELVFEAFTECGTCRSGGETEGFTTTTRAFEFRVGGEWDFVMHGPGRDGLPGVDLLDRDRPAGADRPA